MKLTQKNSDTRYLLEIAAMAKKQGLESVKFGRAQTRGTETLSILEDMVDLEI